MTFPGLTAQGSWPWHSVSRRARGLAELHADHARRSQRILIDFIEPPHDGFMVTVDPYDIPFTTTIVRSGRALAPTEHGSTTRGGPRSEQAEAGRGPFGRIEESVGFVHVQPARRSPERHLARVRVIQAAISIERRRRSSGIATGAMTRSEPSRRALHSLPTLAPPKLGAEASVVVGWRPGSSQHHASLPP
jgi:hypothetical protein